MIKKEMVMKFKKQNPFDQKTDNNNQRFSQDVKNRLNNIRRKLSKGAADIFRMIKTRGNWGNKQLWGNREKGKHGGPTDKSGK